MTQILLALPPNLLPGLTGYLAVSSVILGTLRRRFWVVWFYGLSAQTAHASFTSIVGPQSVSVSGTVMAISEPSVSAVVSVTAVTGLQLWRHFRLRLKPELAEKLVLVGLYLLPSVSLSFPLAPISNAP